MTQEELAKTMGKSQPMVANKLRLLALPEEVQDALIKNQISERHARSLLNIKDKSIVLNYDYKKSLNYFKDNNIKFNIIFVDPPYDYDVLDKVISKILEYNLLEKKGILVIEHTKEIKGDYKDLYLYKAKKYGYKYINIYIRNNWFNIISFYISDSNGNCQ